MNAELTIGRVARGAGVNIQTVRYYERRGLLSPEAYRDSGYRLYSREAVRKLQFIKNAQDLGFALEEISELLRLRVGERTHCGDVKRKAASKLKIVRSRIASLRALEAALVDLIRACRSRSKTDSCPILQSLEKRRGGSYRRRAAEMKLSARGTHWRKI